MPVLTDYQGRAIRLTEERLAHILEHLEMHGMEAVIEATVLEPEVIVQSLSDAQAHLYYRPYSHPRLGEKYICVVVKVLETDAFVITAYLTDRVKRGVTSWPRNS